MSAIEGALPREIKASVGRTRPVRLNTWGEAVDFLQDVRDGKHVMGERAHRLQLRIMDAADAGGGIQMDALYEDLVAFLEEIRNGKPPKTRINPA